MLRRWPETAVVFVRRRMACVGCAMASFETVPEVASAYGIPPELLLQELLDAIGGSSRPPV